MDSLSVRQSDTEQTTKATADAAVMAVSLSDTTAVFAQQPDAEHPNMDPAGSHAESASAGTPKQLSQYHHRHILQSAPTLEPRADPAGCDSRRPLRRVGSSATSRQSQSADPSVPAGVTGSGGGGGCHHAAPPPTEAPRCPQVCVMWLTAN